jgi:hypothetical protein
MGIWILPASFRFEVGEDLYSVEFQLSSFRKKEKRINHGTGQMHVFLQVSGHVEAQVSHVMHVGSLQVP